MFIDYSGGGGEMEIYDSVSITLIESINQTRARERHKPTIAEREKNVHWQQFLPVWRRAIRDHCARHHVINPPCDSKKCAHLDS